MSLLLEVYVLAWSVLPLHFCLWGGNARLYRRYSHSLVLYYSNALMLPLPYIRLTLMKLVSNPKRKKYELLG